MLEGAVMDVDTRDRGTMDGDVIVAADPARPRHHTVAQAPGRPQVSLSTLGEAVQLADAFALSRGVDVWVVSDVGTELRQFRR